MISKNLKEMFKKSVTGTLELIRRQVFEIEQLTHGGGHCHVSVSFRLSKPRADLLIS